MKNLIKTHLYLNNEKDEKGRIAESSLVHGLRNIRLITGRNQDTGLANPGGYLGNWIGAIGYITILDQIGTCYRPEFKERINETTMPSIQKALVYFTSLTKEEIYAVYALRNAFHHDFSLLNINLNKKKYCHHFEVDAHPTNYVIRLPKTPWDGNISSRNRTNATYVNLQALGDLVEGIYTELLRLESENKLVLELDGGELELKARYIFYH
ncbi:MAG: hypothetical protein KGO81_15060 [Bacteroidota bacterium]|nr:hypothetical protein [Bacteroidota bacterium]